MIPDASPHMLGLLGEGLVHFVKVDCSYFAKCKFSEMQGSQNRHFTPSKASQSF